MAFSATSPALITLAGRQYVVNTLTMGMRKRIAAAIAKVPPPRIPPIDVEGLVRSMYRTGPDDEEVIEGTVGKKLKPMELQHIRRDISNTVQEMVRESRALLENWPPPVESTAAQNLIYNNGDVQEVFVWEMLHPGNPELKRDHVPALVEEIAFDEFIGLVDRAFSPANRVLQKMLEDQDAPKSSGAGGDTAT